VLRWLLPVVALLAFLASSVTAFAASGVIGEAACCCPDPDTCKCHDHDDGPQPESEMRRCGGEAQICAPHVVPAIAVTAVAPAIETRLLAPVVHVTVPMPPSRSDRPEKPPS
jgi:hypothetical protein